MPLQKPSRTVKNRAVMIFEQILAGSDNFAYLIAEEKTRVAALVDPALAPQALLEKLKTRGLELKYLINTHSHFDHAGGNRFFLDHTSARLMAWNEKSSRLKDGTVLRLGHLRLTILHTPGHTPDSICIRTGNKLITGDTLFVGTIGKTGFGDDARMMFATLQNKIMPLPDRLEIYPGHDYGPEPQSTLGEEKKSNPFLRVKTFDEFLALKKSRAKK